MGKRQSKFMKVDDYTKEEVEMQKVAERITSKIIDNKVELKHVLMIIESQKVEILELLNIDLELLVVKKNLSERILFRISVCQLVINRMLTNYKKI